MLDNGLIWLSQPDLSLMFCVQIRFYQLCMKYINTLNKLSNLGVFFIFQKHLIKFENHKTTNNIERTRVYLS